MNNAIVLSRFSMGGKTYNEGDIIELNEEQTNRLEVSGLIKIASNKKGLDQPPMNKMVESAPRKKRGRKRKAR